MTTYHRRSFIKASAGTLALAACLSGRRGGAEAHDAISAETIAEAEKLYGLEFTVEERAQLVASIDPQVQVAKARKLMRLPLELQPAQIFDPRLPGVAYSAQENRVRLIATDPGPPPDDDADIAYAPVTALGHWIRGGQLTSRRLTEIYLERIETIAPAIFCYITVTGDLAREQAAESDRELEAGRYRGPLHGIPYGLKDVFDTAGVPTTWGSEIYRNRVPTEDATIVTMLREAGAVLLGKLATGELANGAEWYGGLCRNPWNTAEPAGGSSTGAGAATAAGLCGFSIGTDSLGSILNPADRCGVVGLRATFGRVPVKGGMPLTPSLERIGPLTRTVEDAALVMAAINGFDPTSAASIDMGFEYDGGIDLSGITVGYSPAWFETYGFGPGASAPISDAHLESIDVLKGTGIRLVEVELPALPYGMLVDNLIVEAAAVFEELTLSGRDELVNAEQAWSWPNSWRRAHLISAVDYVQLERFRRQVMLAMHEVFSGVDLLFAPTYGSFELLVTTNFTGHPGVSFRAGLDRSPTRSIIPLPIDPDGAEHTVTQNVSLHGRLFEEGKMLTVARAMERALGVWRHRPPVG